MNSELILDFRAFVILTIIFGFWMNDPSMVVNWLAKNNEIKRESASVENKLIWMKWERKRDGYEHISA